ISPPRRSGSYRGTCRGSAERVPRHHARGITVILGNSQRHRGPKRTPRLVTSLPATVTARGMVGAYLWSVNRGGQQPPRVLSPYTGAGRRPPTRLGDAAVSGDRRCQLCVLV